MSFQDLAKNGGRELSSYQNQASREVEALVFKLAGSVSQLRKLVDVLGTPKDTLDHRHKIANLNSTIQEVSALDDSVRYHEALIEERDAGIAAIQRQIGEVNEMFQDLAVLIADQGEQLQTVDTHITAVAERVKEGRRELVTASRSSRAYRNKCLWLWLVAAVVVSVLLIILLT
ncbi:Syntaxin-22 [Tetrabaena socialis]|uniref:Syntaxin-22 n=1 Tax=Tetrabaena socialis TaxID=47790 RepID=A0A2J7ZVR6_9CHLO|nr:Syntaxin-22 [Tetrabaena socialis]|eukprot:PNH04356.1 Syntaxin-22 [Tetrabaena socialis]